MKQVTITTGKATIVVVDLPEGIMPALLENKEFIVYYTRGYAQIYTSPTDIRSTKYWEVKSLINLGILEYDGGNYELRTRNYQFNSQNYRIGGHPSQLTEEDWKGIVDRSDRHPDDKLYIDYTEESTRYVYLLKTATESGLSLLRANGVVLENNIPPFKERLQDWQKAQEQVWLNPQIFVKL